VLGPTLIDADGIAWSLVDYDGIVGYSATAYLGSVSATVEEADAEAVDVALASTGVFSIGGTATVAGTAGDGLNLRSDATTDGDILALLPDGALVGIVDGPSVDAAGDAWYQVDADGTTGWVHGGYLSGLPATIGNALNAGDGSLGVAVASGSLAYLGTPYVDGGTGVDGLDAAGLVWRVINQDLGVEFPATIAEQSISGEYVAPVDLAPGDLVFFQNTGAPGLAHVGIYLGDGQFTGASNERGAVTIENLADPYWSASYLTARRVAGAAEPLG
jgi:cell wall-associated NlpC family hydrolase